MPIKNVLKHHKLWLFLACIFTIGITILSLVSLGKLSTLQLGFEDKIAHGFAYCILFLVWFIAFRSYHSFRFILILALVIIVYGIIIEVLQTKITLVREGSLNDIIANTIGVLLGVLLVMILKKHRS